MRSTCKICEFVWFETKYCKLHDDQNLTNSTLGSTEVSGDVTYHEASLSALTPDSMRRYISNGVPIGCTDYVSGNTLMIVDEDGKTVQQGIEGELLISGKSLCLGYLKE